MQIPQDETRRRCDLRWSIILFLIWIFTAAAVSVLAVCGIANADDSTVHDSINAYIDHTHRLVRPSKARAAKVFTPIIVRESTRAGLDPFLVAVKIFLESGFKPDSKGARGELGLSQVMPQHCPGCDLETPKGQIRAGCKRLAYAFAQCKTLYGALTHYACGRCVSDSPRTRKKMQWRVKYYKRMKERFGR